MKKFFVYLSFIIFILPISVFAEITIDFECNKNKITSDEVLNCELIINDDGNTAFNKIEGNINVAGASSIDFVEEDGFSSQISNKNFTITKNDSVNVSKVGTLKIKFNDDNNLTRTIKLTDIKLYNDEQEVGTVPDVEKTIEIEPKDIPVVLGSLTVSDCDNCKLSPEFNENVFSYTVTTKSSQIRIGAKAENGLRVTGTGLKQLTSNKKTYVINVSSSSGETKNYKIEVIKEEEKGDVSLKSLTIDNGSLTPKFSPSVTSYSATVNCEKIKISAVANDSNSTVSGTGEKTLKMGKNEFSIVVTSKDGNTKSYLITINRTDTEDVNAYLKELTIDGNDIDFDKDILEYEYEISGDVEKLDIGVVPEHDTSTVTIEGNEDFEIGENVVTITVTAEDGSEKVYTIIVIKNEKEESEDLTLGLNKLEIEGYDIDFSKEKLEYTITIKNEESLDINAVANEIYNVEILGNEDLKDGSIIKIIVTNEEEDSVIYKIKIKVADKQEAVDKEEKKDVNYIPIIMISLLGILLVVDAILLVRKLKINNNE